MEGNMKSIIVLALTITMFLGCGKKESNSKSEQNNAVTFDSSDIKAKPVENPNQSFKINYLMDKDKPYTYRITTIASDKQRIESDTTISQTLNQSVIYLMDISLKNLDQDSVMEFNCNVNSVKVDADVNGQKYSYQSGKAIDSSAKINFSEYAALIDNPFSVRVGKDGEVLEIFRADKIVSKYLELRGIEDSVNSVQRNSIRQSLVNSGIKSLIVLVFRKIPRKQVAVDSSWSYKQPETQLMVYKVHPVNSFKIDKLEQYNGDKLATINAEMLTKFIGENKVTDRGVTYNFTTPESTGGGKIYFNLSKGLIQKSKTQSRFKIYFTMEGMGPNGKLKGSKTEVMTNTNIVELL
jgi:Family of unknown function (DUF6263)